MACKQPPSKVDRVFMNWALSSDSVGNFGAAKTTAGWSAHWSSCWCAAARKLSRRLATSSLEDVTAPSPCTSVAARLPSADRQELSWAHCHGVGQSGPGDHGP